MSKIIGFNNAIFWTDDTEILYCEFSNTDSNIKLERKNVESYIEAITKLCDGKSMPFIVDLRNTCGTFPIAAAKLLAKSPELVKLRISESYLINTIEIKLLIGMYKKLYDKIIPFGIFKDLSSAKGFCQEAKNNYASNSNML
ncbi:hypothetical protein HNV10_05285 [Winogradskyella litoriviva]|uniref:DUF7793 domain-containing protein n=1 Tax=Winogradskyella litoriviva TaxID=1220182 RepID=A0ABX2E3L5_9FLAO|nr:hypothetical protein [Winogradskyella litoriviva]NRD22643.1 hypothetical protein [Winogradskyella litoriviva]